MNIRKLIVQLFIVVIFTVCISACNRASDKVETAESITLGGELTLLDHISDVTIKYNDDYIAWDLRELMIANYVEMVTEHITTTPEPQSIIDYLVMFPIII